MECNYLATSMAEGLKECERCVCVDVGGFVGVGVVHYPVVTVIKVCLSQ